jgi:3-oxoadipate enol-lactonase
MEDRMSGELGFAAGRWPLDEDKPTLVFIHGAANNRLFWQFQVRDLTDVVNTVAIDLPGHGKSQGPGRDQISEYAITVLELIEQLRISDPIPCGLSMGGAITLQLLIDHGERFSAGILMNTGARLRVSPVIFNTIHTDFEKFVESIVRMAISGKSDADALRPIIQEITDCEPEVAYGDFKACDRFNVVNNLAAIQRPVLVLTADDDVLTPVKYGQFMGDKIIHASVQNIDGAGHMSPLEKPDAVNRAIRHFLRQIGRADVSISI